VTEYGEISNKLAHYAPDDASTDAKRQSKFMRGLNDEISIQLVAVRFNSYQELLDRVVVVEDKHRRMENHKRKFNHGNDYSVSYQKPHSSYEGNESSGNRHGGHNHHSHEENGHDHNGYRDHNKNHGNGNGNGNGSNNGRNYQNNLKKKNISQVLCYNCKKLGHYASDCLEKERNVEGSIGNKPNQFPEEHINHVNVEEVFEAPNVATRKF
jgi:hypothetical protein